MAAVAPLTHGLQKKANGNQGIMLFFDFFIVNGGGGSGSEGAAPTPLI